MADASRFEQFCAQGVPNCSILLFYAIPTENRKGVFRELPEALAGLRKASAVPASLEMRAYSPGFGHQASSQTRVAT